MLTTLEDLEKEYQEKRARVVRDIATAATLPVAEITWTSENGWDKAGKALPPIQRTAAIKPWIIHAPFRGADQVAYKAPDSFEGGESTSSKYRQEFERKYLRAVVEMFRPFMIDAVARKGQYHSIMSEDYDWKSDRDYSDSVETGRGQYIVDTRMSLGENYFSSAELAFYVRIGARVVRVSLKLPGAWGLMPVAHGVSRNGDHVSRVHEWRAPANHAALHIRYAGGNSGNRSTNFLYLFANLETLSQDLDFLREPK